MLSELILALPAAILVGIVPGWFWTRLLLASSDLPERIACSVGLSMALVPTAALVQARLVGSGVTLSVAIASPLVVFLIGFVGYLWFGGAKGSEKPLGLPAAPLGVPARKPR